MKERRAKKQRERDQSRGERVNIKHGREAEGKANQRDVEKDKGIENRIEEQRNGDQSRGNRK